ncbi:MAG: glycosyltransferase family 4 protein [Chloroflexota bacterium]
MRLLFVADGRSPTALNWIEYWIKRGDEVHLASTFTCSPALPLRGLDFVPVAFSGAGPAPVADSVKNPSTRSTDFSRLGVSDRLKSVLQSAAFINLRAAVRHWLGPLTLPRSARRLADAIQRVRPDLVHALRVPYEGMLAAEALRQLDSDIPLLVSIWGNDFTLHAPSTPLMGIYTRRTMQTAAALHADCQRDIRLAQLWDFDPGKPSIVLPGNGGLDLTLFHPPAERDPSAAAWVVNPRGFRAYVRNDTFFKAIPLVLERKPEARFACPAMEGEAEAEKWLAQPGIANSVMLLPKLSRPELAGLFRTAQVVVSPSTHDGTPNSLIEAMACGCFPVAGDLDSIREWITPGVNGLLVDPDDPSALAGAILSGLENAELREQAQRHNAALLAERAEYGNCMSRAAEFYQSTIANASHQTLG